MTNYNGILNMHAFKSLFKIPDMPDTKLAIGSAENLENHTNVQLGATAPVSNALVDPQLLNYEDRGLVGDGNGVLTEADFDTTSFDMGLPYYGGI